MANDASCAECGEKLDPRELRDGICGVCLDTLRTTWAMMDRHYNAGGTWGGGEY